jgi:hypothetical protein
MPEAMSARGRPRKWPSDAERKRAYRARRAAELAGPEAVRAEARAARAEAVRARRATERARRQAEYWRRRATASEQRRERDQLRIRTVEQGAQRARAERDEARRLLRSKLRWARDARVLSDDPEALLALVAELRRELDGCRRELVLVRQALRQAPVAWAPMPVEL